MPKVSIIIATYNRAQKIRRCIMSVLNQTYTNVEVIVVDDGSSDDTLVKLRLVHDERLRVISYAENRGATYARNKGLSEASGLYTIVWDSDDVLYPNAIEVLVKKAQEKQGCVVVSAPTRVLRADTEVIFTPLEQGALSFERILCARMPKYKLVRMVNMTKAGHVRYMSKNLDFLYNVLVASVGEWFHLAVVLGDHFLESDAVSLTGGRKVKDISVSVDRARTLVSFLEVYGDRLCALCPSHFASYAYGASVGLLLDGDVRQGRLFAARALLRNLKMRYVFFLLFSILPFSDVILRALYSKRILSQTSLFIGRRRGFWVSGARAKILPISIILSENPSHLEQAIAFMKSLVLCVLYRPQVLFFGTTTDILRGWIFLKKLGIFQSIRLITDHQQLTTEDLNYIDRLITYSMEEQTRFGNLGLDRCVFLRYPSKTEAIFSTKIVDEGYVFCGGTNKRDHDSFLQAIGQSGVKALLVTGNAVKVPIPINCTKMNRVSLGEYVSLMSKATVVAVPLLQSDYPHGHCDISMALSLGKPVVSTKGASVGGYVVSGVNGELVEAGDVIGYATVFERIFSDKEYRDRLSATALKSATDFSYDTFAGLLSDILGGLLKRQ